MTEDPLAALPNNKEVAGVWISYLLGELFAEFPRRQSFTALDVASQSGVEPRRDPEEFFDDLVLWLKDNGYVRFTQSTDGAAFDVALTERGFTVLGQKPEGLDRPLGSKLKEIATGVAREGGKAAIAQTVGTLFGAAAATFLGPGGA